MTHEHATRAPRALPPLAQELLAPIDELMHADRARLRRQLDQLADLLRRGKPHDRLLAGIQAAIVEAGLKLENRKRSLPPRIDYPPELPISAARERIREALEGHQVVILAGDTGSGKTTQLPKLCLEIGRGIKGMIGHTQPRRIAAQAVAARIAEELGPTGERLVAWQVRFTDRSTPETLVKLMTDGILLAEIQQDRRLERYDTIIIDEAHERSLNIDFLLGYLKRLLPERPELKLVITSATIDVERFARHFSDAPVIEVSGRTYPVELWYRQPPEEDPDLPQAIIAAIEELVAHERGTPHAGRGDILVFHAGEREIRETALAIRRSTLQHVEVLPLYSRLSSDEQARVLRPSSRAGRRIVLATNVAETSLTVPGIRYVIDPGLARISRYSVRSKVQRLPIEPISQASAAQRAGRCGRLSDGICVRLYGEDDFAARPAFTDPEILRTGLASVILRMQLLGLGEVARYPFLDPPDERQINDGVRLLEELGALDGRRLTPLGNKLARLPVDPRIARMLVAAAQLGALAEMLVIASFLSIQDPRERPVDKQQAADEKHRRFACETSDFVSMLNLWRYVEEQRQALSLNQFRKLCGREFLSFLRVREWRDIHHQLRLVSHELGLHETATAASEDTIARAVLAGMLTHIGTRTEERDYDGVRNRRFLVHPGSFLFRKQPKWVVCAELVETTRLYARGVAAIDPDWILQWAEHLVKREHHSPHWNSRSGKVLAKERIRLFGLVISDERSVDFGRIDPVEARRLFIQAALVEGDYRSQQRFWRVNQKLRADIEMLEAKGRRRDLAVDDRVIFAHYDERLPPRVHDHPSLEKWLREELPANADALCMQRETLLRAIAADVGEAQFPDVLEWRDLRIPLAYRYEPGHPADGVTAIVPLALLERFPLHLPDWLVPGLLRDKLIALVKSLPKQYRKVMVPVPDSVDRLATKLRRGDVALTAALGDAIREEFGVDVPADAWRADDFDVFYRMNIRVVDAARATVGEGRDVAALKRQLFAQARDALQSAMPAPLARGGITEWSVGALPREVEVPGTRGSRGFPALRDAGDSVAIETLSVEAEARLVHREGVRRLLWLQGGALLNGFRRSVLRETRAWLGLASRFDRATLVEDLLLAAVDACVPEQDLPRDKSGFDALLGAMRARLGTEVVALEKLLLRIGEALHAVAMGAKAIEKPAWAAARADIQAQLARLFDAGFIATTPRRYLERYPTWLKAIAQRQEKLPLRAPRDLECTTELAQLQARLDEYLRRHADLAARARVAEYRWLLEEYRVSLFAQQLGTLQPVSRQRLDRLWDAIVAERQGR